MDKTNWTVELNDEDITASVLDISDISAELDIETPIEFNSSNARVLVKYDDLKELSADSEIKIKVDNNTVFLGRIVTIDRNLKNRTADVVLGDATWRMRNEVIEDFGITKRVRVTATDEDSGEYPFTPNLTPVSHKSLKNPISTDRQLKKNELVVVDHFKTEGKKNKSEGYIAYDETTLRSEGTTSLNPNPDVTIKAPYRWKTIRFVVKKILEHYDVEHQDPYELPRTTKEPHFSTRGRVSYDVEHNASEDSTGEGTETALFWTGQVTDFLIDNNKYYFLYSGRTSNPSIIEYDPGTDEYKELYKRDAHAEWWRFQKDGDKFYVLGTTLSTVNFKLPVLGSYDPTENNASTLIELVDTKAGSHSAYIRNNHNYRPVVGMYYQMGFEPDGANNNVRQGIQPDSRKGFILHDDALYYIYASPNSLIGSGIAKATAAHTATSFVRVPKDDYFSHLGIDFTIHDDVLYGGTIYQKERESSRIIFKKAL